MVNEEIISGHSARVRAALKATYGVGGRNVARATKRAGRLLPSHVRAAAHVLADAEALGGHPKLMRVLDARALRTAERTIVEHLESIDVADRRKGQLLGLAGAIAFNLILIMVLLVMWLVWRGFL